MTAATGSAPRLIRERPLPTLDDSQRDDELRQARRSLLRTPWMTRDTSPEDFRLVRRHRDALVAWFSEALGYQLKVESDTARLKKAPIESGAGRPLLRVGSGRPFPPLGYAVLVCVLAALSRARSQLLLDDLAREVRTCASEAGLDLDLEKVGDRRLLAAALRHLLEMGVLVERDGSVEGWDVDGRIQALLDVRRDRLALMLDVRLGGATGAADLIQRESLPSAAGGARLRARRILVESPVLDISELNEDQIPWWRRNRAREAEQLQEWLGLSVELRAEGAVAIDPSGELSDRLFPGHGTVPHAALLVLSRLVDTVRSEALAAAPTDRVWRQIQKTDVQTTVRDVVDEHGRAFAKEYRDDPDALTTEVTRLLSDFGLLRSTPSDGVLELHAASARFAPKPIAVDAPPSLFDEVDENESGDPT